LAQQRKSLADPLRLGVDHALVDSGLAHALLRAFGVDTGIAVKAVPGAALPLLEGLERGEIDAALTNTPDAEARLDKQGLLHDRQAIAGGEFVIVGPAVRGKGEDVFGAALGHDAVGGLKRLAAAAPGSFTFLTAGDGSGAHAAEQALWRQAGVAPVAPWYVALAPGDNLIAQVRARGAFALVERAAWLARGGAPLEVRVDGDPRLAEEVHVMRAFRVNHPAGKIFVAWIASAKGRRVVAAHRGYRAGA
jgi:tungstate transport system substrate-binding protein